MKNIFVFFLLVPVFLFSQQTMQIGFGENNTYKIPFNGLYDYSHEMFIYTESEIGLGAKEIFEFSFYLEGYNQGYQFNDITIKVAHTSNDQFDNSVKVDLSGLVYSDLTTCVLNRDVVITENGWFKLGFDTSFEYKGSGNLLVIVENRDGTWSPGFGYTQCTYDNSSYRSWIKFQDNDYPEGYGTRSKERPNLIYNYFNNNPLPINLLSFEADFIGSTLTSDVLLKWETASESNNDYYTLYRSIDGVYWEIIASINGAGSSTERLSYQFLDRSVGFSEIHPVFYYKLSQTDFDGNSEEFDPIAVRLKSMSKKIISKTNIIGQEVKENKKGLIIEVYEGGQTSKTFNF